MSEREPSAEEHQALIDEICHYRALAILNGAGECDMMNDYDRRLVRLYEKEKGTPCGEHWTATRDEVRDCWAEDDARVRAAVAAERSALYAAVEGANICAEDHKDSEWQRGYDAAIGVALASMDTQTRRDDIGLIATLAIDAAVSAERAACAAVADEWVAAYPLRAFPEPDLKRCAEVLKAAGLTIDVISASAMRHAAARMGEDIRARTT